MRNLSRLTYAANRTQAWADWDSIAQQAEENGKFGLVCGLEPPSNATTRQIDKAISLLRSALQSSGIEVRPLPSNPHPQSGGQP